MDADISTEASGIALFPYKLSASKWLLFRAPLCIPRAADTIAFRPQSHVCGFVQYVNTRN